MHAQGSPHCFPKQKGRTFERCECTFICSFVYIMQSVCSISIHAFCEASFLLIFMYRVSLGVGYNATHYSVSGILI
jgi:hypothetical protein